MPNALASQSTDDTNRPGVSVAAGRDISIGEVVVGEKIVNNIQNIQQRALTAAEEAAQERSLEAQLLAQGVAAFAQRLQTRVGEAGDADKGSPYKGLLEYRLGDAANFFGREQAVAELLEKLERGALTVLHSESGAGKTSLVQAGLSPHLIAAGHLPMYLRPYNAEPALVIKRAIISDPSQTPILATAPLRDFLRQVCGVLGASTTLYICLDQFEEFFTQLAEPERAEFVRELAECLDDESLASRVRWVLALRTEYFGNLANFRPRVRNPFENDFRLNRLTRAEAHEVIRKPAEGRGLTFEAGLIDSLLDDLGQKDIAPPQLQLVCSALYEELESGETTFTRALYEREGRAAGILRGHLERVLSRDLLPPQRAAARRLLESLISSEAQRVVRTHAELVAELSARGVTPETLGVILNQLVDSRLLRAQESQEGGELSYELAHDYLLGEIQLDPEVQARKAAQELLEQEVRAYRRFKTLLTTERLAVIEPYRAALRLTPEAEQLLAQSIAEVERDRLAEEARRQKELDDARKLAEETEARRLAEADRAREAEQSAKRARRLTRIIGGVGALALIAAVVAGVLGFASNQNANIARTAEAHALAEASNRATAEAIAQTERAEAERQAQIAFSRQLTAQGQAVYEGDPLLGVRLVLEGLARVPEGEAATTSALADELHSLLEPGRRLDYGRVISAVVPFPDESRVVVHDPDGPSQLYSLAEGGLLTQLSGPVTQVVFILDPDRPVYDPDRIPQWTAGPDLEAQFFAVTYAGGRSAELRRVADGALVDRLVGSVAYLRALNFSPEWRFVVVHYRNPDVPDELRRASDGALVQRLSGPVAGLTFDADPASANFVVNYTCFESPCPSDELRRKADGAIVPLVVPLSGLVSYLTVSRTPEASYLVVHYADGPHVELRRLADGGVVPLSGPVQWIQFSFPEGKYFVVNYSDETPDELRRAGDGERLAQFSGLTSAWFGPDTQVAYLVAAYEDGQSSASGLFRADDGTLIASLSGRLDAWNSWVSFSPDPASTHAVVRYGGQTGGELWRLADGVRLAQFAQPDFYVEFSPDGMSLLVDYPEGIDDELWRTTDGAKLLTAPSGWYFSPNRDTGESVFHPSRDETYVVLYNPDEGLTEVWSAADGALVTGPGRLDVSFNPNAGSRCSLQVSNYTLEMPYSSIEPGGPFSTAEFWGFGSGEDYFFGNYNFGEYDVTGGGEDRAYSAAYHANNCQVAYELSDLYDFLALAPERGWKYLVVSYSRADQRGELRRVQDGAVLQYLTGDPERVHFSPGNDPAFFIVEYSGSIPAELRRMGDGALLAQLVDGIAEAIWSDDPETSFVMIKYVSGQNELWTTRDPPRRLAQLGFGLADHVLDPADEALVVRYLDDRAYLLSLGLLGDLTLPSMDHSPEALADLACRRLFGPNRFDEARLRPYLNDEPPRACVPGN